MKTARKTSGFIFFALSIFLAGFAPNNMRSDLPKFVILVEHTDDGLNLVCETGCAWKQLSFTIKPHAHQAVDQYGMTLLSKHKALRDDNADGFLFTIEKTAHGFKCQGIKGTSWLKVTSECSIPGCKQYVGHDGTWDRRKG